MVSGLGGGAFAVLTGGQCEVFFMFQHSHKDIHSLGLDWEGTF